MCDRPALGFTLGLAQFRWVFGLVRNTSLPLYYISFFKEPKKVIEEMVRIQRNFLWGGSEDSRKMAWVRWSKLCLPKEWGGLGIRNMEVFNLALLGKWRWKLKVDKECLWGNLLKYLYGEDGFYHRNNSLFGGKTWSQLMVVYHLVTIGLVTH